MAVNPKYQAPQGSNGLVDRIRGLIEAAERGGANRADLRLKLTLHDNAALRRNRNLDVADLRFQDGEMWFMNVLVTPGSAERSELVNDAVA